jgi:hypothetical protein
MTPHSKESDQKAKVRNRIKSFYHHLDHEDWTGCYQFVDPKLRDGKVDYVNYAKSLAAFYSYYGPIRVVSVQQVTIHGDVRSNKHDDRDFAYGLVVWKDKRNQPHLLRERWVKSGENWYTRMVGLATHAGANTD